MTGRQEKIILSRVIAFCKELRPVKLIRIYRSNYADRTRRGIPNPFIAELWKDDDFYLKVIEAREKTLSPEQVRKIRELNKFGKSIIQITQEVDALNKLQVKNVLLGRTYSRIV